jgi:hypothetical protein
LLEQKTAHSFTPNTGSHRKRCSALQKDVTECSLTLTAATFTDTTKALQPSYQYTTHVAIFGIHINARLPQQKTTNRLVTANRSGMQRHKTLHQNNKCEMKTVSV